MSVFFTDTDCEFPCQDIDKYDIKLIGMPYTLDGEEKIYDMGRNTDFSHLFNRMREGSIPTTSALNPQDYIDYFEPYFAKGEDIFYVHFSDKLSATFNHMATALNTLKEKYPQRQLITFNTKSISGGGGFIALEAAKLHHSGMSDKELLEFLEEFAPKIAMHVMVDSLQHLKRGGRLSATGAILGTLLNIKPLIKITSEGTIAKTGTEKGRKKAFIHLAKLIKEKGLKFDKYPVQILHADVEEDAKTFQKLIKEIVPEANTVICPVGPVIGAHCGPGTIGVVFYATER